MFILSNHVVVPGKEVTTMNLIGLFVFLCLVFACLCWISNKIWQDQA